MKAIICKNRNKTADSVISDVITKLNSFGIDAEYREDVGADCDVIITVGGDGTILHYGKAAAKLNKPLLGINTGRLGFMTTIEIDETDKLEALVKGNYQVSRRMMLEVEVNGEKHPALNDAVFYKDVDSKLPEFKVSAGGQVISELRSDGLILSTPTGSTAYALSAGGPIIEPWLECIELTPLCAHSLFGRPMILSADEPITVEYEGVPDKIYVSADGDAGIAVKKGQQVIIRKSALYLPLIDLEGGSFHKTVREKLLKTFK